MTLRGLPLEQVNGNKALYYYQDVLGSTRAIVNSNGSTQATYVYGAYGNLKSSTGTVSNPFQFAGQYVDSESGLQYLRARYYDPTTNQFLTVDPVVAETQEPYSYAADDPVNLVDPTGLHTVGICLTGGAGVGSGFFLQGCIQIELGRGWDDRVGVTGTVGGGAGTPSVSINVSPVTTTATSISDLNGPFVYLGGSGGEGPSVGYDAFIGRTARCGSYVFGGGPTIGLDGNPPFPPVEVHGGVSDTWSWVPGGDPPDDPSPCSCQGK